MSATSFYRRARDARCYAYENLCDKTSNSVRMFRNHALRAILKKYTHDVFKFSHGRVFSKL